MRRGRAMQWTAAATALSVTVSIAGFGGATSALAQAATREEAVAQVLRAAEQRMLAQRIGGLGCQTESGIEVPGAAEALAEARARYAGNRAALAPLAEFGGTVAADARAESEAAWGALEALMAAMAASADRGPRDFDNMLRHAARLSVADDGYAAALTSATVGAGQIDIGGAVLFDLYARQHMLAERIGKELCLVVRGDRGIGAQFELAASAETFRSALPALSTGRPDAGIPAPPTPGIAARLVAAQALWDQAAPVVAAAAEGAATTPQDATRVAALLPQVTAELGAALALLAEHAADGGS